MAAGALGKWDHPISGEKGFANSGSLYLHGHRLINRLAFAFWFCSGVKVAFTFLFFQQAPIYGTLTSSVLSLCLCYFLSFAILSLPRRNSFIQWPKAAYIILAYLIWAGITIFWTEAVSKVSAIGYWLTMVAEVSFVVGALRYGNPGAVVRASLKGIVSSGVVLAIIALLLSGGTSDERLGNEAFLHPNALGQLFAIACFCCIYLAVDSKPRNPRWLFAVASLFLYGALLRTLSKTINVAFLFTALWYFFGLRIAIRKKLAVLAAVSVLALVMYPIFERYLEAYLEQDSGEQLLTLTGRTILWEDTWEMVKERPILGHGFIAYRQAGPQWADLRMDHAHNEWLQQWFALGLVGLCLTVAIYVATWQHFRKMSRFPGTSLQGMLATSLFFYALLRGLTDADITGLAFPISLLVLLLGWQANEVDSYVRLQRA
jgi:exopolysaccharide production protein ExoQ